MTTKKANPPAINRGIDAENVLHAPSGRTRQMTETEWLVCTRTNPMLRFLLGLGPKELRVVDIKTFPACRGSDRKMRLFACECYYRVRALLPDELAEAAVETARRHADGLATLEELQAAEALVRQALDSLEGRWRASHGAERTSLQPTHDALALSFQVVRPQAPKAAYYASSNAHLAAAAMANPGAASGDTSYAASSAAEEHAQADVLRDIFGNPFRAVAFDPDWRTSTAVGLARQMYESRVFGPMPILADALLEAGCEDADVLGHCRGDGRHVRGCWVIDALLGKG
ncbi:hypothetical protein ACSRUE_19830 [Sorangium sp. KYC3313]|uniref:hypothetical protein n=1 Tax=Sorangium sp. KYC3313 TaxID=3449740 RepID=UPI003F8C5F85